MKNIVSIICLSLLLPYTQMINAHPLTVSTTQKDTITEKIKRAFWDTLAPSQILIKRGFNELAYFNQEIRESNRFSATTKACNVIGTLGLLIAIIGVPLYAMSKF